MWERVRCCRNIVVVGMVAIVVVEVWLLIVNDKINTSTGGYIVLNGAIETLERKI